MSFFSSLPSISKSLVTSHRHLFAAENRPQIGFAVTSFLVLAMSLPILYQDYRAYLALGEGGFPHNAFGWLLTSCARLLKRETTSTGEYDQDLNKDSFFAEDLPVRKGERPRIGGHPVPHRQINQIPSSDITEHLKALLPAICDSRSTTLTLTTSVHERHLPGIFIHSDLSTPHAVAADAFREIAHAHSNLDSSLHVVLSPQDCKKVIEAGWGERHPCSGRIKGLPKEYLMVYAPRDDEEIKIVRKIIEAAADFMCGDV